MLSYNLTKMKLLSMTELICLATTSLVTMSLFNLIKRISSLDRCSRTSLMLLLLGYLNH